MEELISKIVSFILDHQDIIQTLLKKALTEAGKAGIGEIGKIAAREGKEKIGKILQKLFSKPSVRNTVLNTTRDKDTARKVLSETIKIVLTVEPQIILLAEQEDANLGKSPDRATADVVRVNTLRDYLLTLQKQISSFDFPGLPKFPAGIDVALGDIYVEQKVIDKLSNRLVQLDYYIQLSKSLWLQDVAGTGKSTALWRFAALLSQDKGSDEEIITRLPVRIHANDLTGIEAPILNSLLERVKEIYALSDEVINRMVEYFVNGEAVLLIDGLDEVSNKSRAQIASIVKDIAFSRGNQLIIGSRPLLDFSLNIPVAKINRFNLHDAYQLVSNWQVFFQQHNAIDPKSDELLSYFKESVLNDIYRMNDIRKTIIENPLFLTFLIFYFLSPEARDTKNPFQILGNKTLLLSRIVEFVIPYWETQKGQIDLITPVKNEEALSVLYLIAFLAKDMPDITWREMVRTLEYSQNSLQLDVQTIRQYFESWVSTNVIVPSIGTSTINFWHEEIKDFCVARYLLQLQRKGLLNETMADDYLGRDNWKFVARYYDNLARIGG